MVSALLQMQARAKPAARDDLLKAADRVQSIAEAQDAIYARGLGDTVAIGAYLATLCQRLSAALLDPDRIRLRTQAPPTTVRAELAVCLGMIVNELVTNAARHAFPHPARGEIRVSVTVAEDRLSLTVEDTGIGLPDDFEARAGVGMKLVRTMTRQSRGSLEVGQGPGARFEIRVPNPAVRAPA